MHVPSSWFHTAASIREPHSWPSLPSRQSSIIGSWGQCSCKHACVIHRVPTDSVVRYQFAVLLAGCRDIMRPGSMWFIKDPQDQNFHPIRDILERPTLVQIRKLLLSGAMYSVVIAAGVGTVTGMLQLFSKTVLPLRWKIRYACQSPICLE